MSPPTSYVYASLENTIEVFRLGKGSASLTHIQSLTFDVSIQYAWPNRTRTMLYVVSSGAGPMSRVKVPSHFVQVFRILQDGILESSQDPVRLENRPLFVTLDQEENHLLIAYNNPSDVTVHKIDENGRIDDQVLQMPLYFGMTAHQVRVTPHGNTVVVPACAHHVNGILAGCVDLFHYKDGLLSPQSRITADPSRVHQWRGVKNGGLGFSARHIEFHPTQPWMFLLLETQSELHLYDYDENGVSPNPRFIKSTLTGARFGASAQWASAIHFHPNGRFVYVANRAWDTEPNGADDVFVGGANTIAVFELNQTTGEPTLIQQIETRGIFPRTFGMDAQGKTLAVGNQEFGLIRSDNTLRQVRPSLVVFDIGEDGHLTFTLQHEHPDNDKVSFWSTVLTLNNDASERETG